MSKLPSLSIFFPAFNEEENITSVVEKALKVAPQVAEIFEIIVVDDGSSDKTAEEVEKIAKSDKKVRLLRHKQNKGYGAALRSGFYASKYNYITYMDADRQFDFGQLKKLVEQIDGADLVIGFRKKREDNFLRVLNGKMWNFLAGMVLGVNVKDIDCGFKLAKKEVIDKIPKLESSGATISAELLAKSKKNGFVIKQVGLDHKERKFGKATGGNLLHIFRAFRDLLYVRDRI